MKDISYHILDIVQNSLHAGATKVVISIREDTKENLYELCISDNGHGIEKEMLERVTDPFYTTGTTKRVGLGLPLLKQNAEMAGGYLDIRSVRDNRTTVKAVFMLDHIDRLPEGNVGDTLRVLIAANPSVDFVYRYGIDGREWAFDTGAVRKELDPVPVSSPEVLDFIVNTIENEVAELKKKP